jgi:Fe-S cluster biogenesis protein NfuA/nitrite reductase/ring-hydroxylating ferredoxin subunit
MAPRDGDVRGRVAAVERALAGLDALPPAAREAALAALRSVTALYGEGLARVVARVGPVTAADLADDGLLGHLFVVHDLHPVPLGERVARALDAVRPYLRSHGGDVELLALDGAAVRVRLTGSCRGCPSSALTLRRAVEDAIGRAAPEIERVETDDAGGTPPPAWRASAWTAVDDLADLTPGQALLREVGGVPVLFVDLDGVRYAYRPACPACGGRVVPGPPDGARLRCPCGVVYDVRGAGRALDGSRRALEPVPLLPGAAGGVRIALGAEAA